MTDEFKKILGSAIDAVAKTMRPGDGPIPLHCIEAVVNQCLLDASRIASEVSDMHADEWKRLHKASEYLEGKSDGADDVSLQFLMITGGA